MAETKVIRDLLEVHRDEENSLIFEKNVSIPLRNSDLPVRCNVYRPLESNEKKFPVLVTYGPYGKDIPYATFHAGSFNEVNTQHKSKYSAWETPDPVFWTRNGYVVVRCDERGLGQSPGLLDTMSRGTSECFFDVVEWAAEQPWSSGKVGLLGISYYAGTQWRVAARKPKGLAAIIPWEGMSDYYRDRCRHGGILSNSFISFWWNRQVLVNQYGKAGRSKLQFPLDGPGARGQEDTIEGDLSEDALKRNRRDQTEDNEANRFLDEEYYSSKTFDFNDIEVPLLSVANWGGILLHLRGNVEGYRWAGSKLKYLRFITGRHDLPFYYEEEVNIQKSFLDAFLRGVDPDGWSIPGKLPPVTLTLRKGNVGYNNAVAEKSFPKRTELAWPIPRTEYTKYFLTPEQTLHPGNAYSSTSEKKVSYEALGSLAKPYSVHFKSHPFQQETEITGHILAHLNVSVTPPTDQDPADGSSEAGDTDIDIFLTLRHFEASGREVLYTGTAGDGVPLTKGWLRVSLRKTDPEHPRHNEYMPYRAYRSTDVQEVHKGVVYAVDVEIWPTNVVVEKGGRLALEVSSGDTQGCGIFKHESEIDRHLTRIVTAAYNYFRSFSRYTRLHTKTNFPMATLQNKVAIVTGSDSGIGAQIARELSILGANVVINYPFSQFKERAKAVLKTLATPGIAVEADISTIEGPNFLIEQAVAAYGKIDIVVNNAGIAVNLPFEDQTLAHWDSLVNLNCRGTFLTTQAALKYLSPRDSRIVNICSISAKEAPAMQTIYAGTKGMVDSMTRVWAKELPKKYGCTVNSVSPGPTMTEGFAQAGDEMMKMLQPVIDKTPGGARLGKTEEIAYAVTMLCSPKASWINGVNISACGGLWMS
ncbi:hypothetical protein G7Y89_g13077 [Cudoniella acicularis]|uniref:Xaa-Pro dipeptidyl-peptidase C-terminal domain-containing protein n=1 Tax=Cudoniella acicularis TaxID=354080 RepID=A0A8H4VWE4_9HELO|nr:hypothetical protein G7Y89_g13077 [Cudoniella acicularis]